MSNAVCSNAMPDAGGGVPPQGRPSRPRRLASDRELSAPPPGWFLALSVPREWGGSRRRFPRSYAGVPRPMARLPVHRPLASSTCTDSRRIRLVLQSAEITTAAKRHVADLVVQQGKLIGGNFSEPGTTSLVGERGLTARARRVDGGYSITGRKMFASMLRKAAGLRPGAGLPRTRGRPGAGHAAAGAARLRPGAASIRTGTCWACAPRAGDSLVTRRVLRARTARGDVPTPGRHAAVPPGVPQLVLGIVPRRYLGVAVAAYREMIRVRAQARQPPGAAQPLIAYHSGRAPTGRAD